MRYRWTQLPKPDVKVVQNLVNSLQVEESMAVLLVQRGITDFEQARSFFRPSLDDLHSPFLMKDMEKAVRRIEKALANSERIMVYGDYDVDGTTSVALVSSYLERFSSLIVKYIPDRYSEGYGVSYQGIDFAKDNEISLIVALDCGIKAVDKIAYANKYSIDFIICDHHRPGEKVPDAVAILNPKQSDCPYPYKELCGCGVGFKLLQALEQNQGRNLEIISSYLDLVAIAIGADIVPITGENRVLMYFGLQQINSSPSVGVRALLSKEDKPERTVTDLVFGIAPRINAAGRMKHGILAVDILTEKNEESLTNQAETIEELNTHRKQLDEQITQQALLQIQENKEENNCTSVVFHPTWHKGVIGIVASRLIETYYRPTLVFTKSGDRLAASARSVRGFDIYRALEACSDFIEQFGGHKYAAGLTLLPEQYVQFKQAFEEVVSKTLPKSLQIPEIVIDKEISLQQITPKFYRILKQFAPFGPKNMRPIFMTCGISEVSFAKKIGKNNEHLRFTVIDSKHHIQFSCIGFGLANKWDLIEGTKPFDMVYHIEENHWQGRTTLQLRVKDIRASI